jgi:mono/diheme cytochrome c family protein
MKRVLQLGLIIAALVVVVPFWLEGVKQENFTAQAMPAWSRKYNADCSLCHTTYPRLNRAGYEFKRLGYRFKWELEAASKGNDSAVGRASPAQPSNQPDDASAAQRTGTYVPAPGTESSREGERLYKELECNACHAIGTEGGKVGPGLDGMGARRTREFLIGHITDPQAHAGDLPKEHPQGASMPATSASAEQIGKMVDYLLTLPDSQETRERKARISDYFAVSYLPGVEFENEGGTTTTTFEKRELLIFAAGPVGRNFSFFVQPIPLSEEKGFLGKFEMIQGLLNFRGAQNFAQVRFGQIFNLRNAGFGGTDRGLTETIPFIFQPINGFNPSGLGRGVSAEYTIGRSTTFKVFANSNEAVEVESEEPPSPELRRSRTYGFAYEQILGKKGLSGVQFQFAGGSTPFFLDGLRQPSFRFQRYSFFANKAFQDRKNFERVNAIFGLSFLRDSRFLGVDVEQRSRGYGYFMEVDTVPVVKHLSLFGRYDQLRQTTLIGGNTLRGGTFGVIFDPIRYARVSFEYQRLAGLETVNRYRIGLQLNY